MTFNSELADRVLGVIEANPELHEQGSYAMKTDCGTALCFAGWTVQLEHQLQPDDYVWVKDYNNKGSYADTMELDGYLIDISDEAAALLGITDHQADHLFYSQNTVDDLKRIVKEIANGEL